MENLEKGVTANMAGFPEEWITELLSRTDIVSIIGEYTPLKEKNNRFWGLCPFHGEKTPSFSVQPDKQFFYCFGCHAGGNVIHFLMEMEKLSFVDTVKTLANRVNMPLPEQVDAEQYQQQRALRDRLYAVCKEAALYYYQMLKSEAGKPSRAYFANRGIDASTIVRFGLGYSQPSWTALKDYLIGRGFKEEDLIAAGLLQQRNNRTYDTFRGRVMYPIIGTYQRVIGFGARTLGDDQPKYLNSSETEVFSKRTNLYGLNLLKGKQLQDVILVEGYMDVIGLHQYGIENAVASLGTALTIEQARLLQRQVKQIYLAYDGDSAGQNAMMRGLKILEEVDLEVGVICLPKGQDPDDFVRHNGKEAFKVLKQQALKIPQYYLQHWQSDYNLDDIDDRIAYTRKASAYIEGLLPMDRERYYQELSRIVEMDEQIIKQEGQLARPVSTQSNKPSSTVLYEPTRYVQKDSEQTREQEEQVLIKAGMAANISQEQWGKLLEIIVQPVNRKLVQCFIKDNQYIPEQRLSIDFEKEEAEAVVSILHLEEPDQPEQVFCESLQTLQVLLIDAQINQLHILVDQKQNSPEERRQYTQEIVDLQRKRNQLD